jgi:hypothetical protein
MARSRVWEVVCIGALGSCCLLGCGTLHTSHASPAGLPDPFLCELLKQDALEKKPGVAVLKPDLVLQEIPRGTPVAQARTIMEGHGFTCWPGVPHGLSTVLYCMAYQYRAKDQLTDKVVVELYYDAHHVVGAEVTVYYEEIPPSDWFWPWSPTPRAPVPTAPSTPAAAGKPDPAKPTGTASSQS